MCVFFKWGKTIEKGSFSKPLAVQNLGFSKLQIGWPFKIQIVMLLQELDYLVPCSLLTMAFCMKGKAMVPPVY